MACKWPLFCIVVLWKLCLGTFTGATKDFLASYIEFKLLSAVEEIRSRTMFIFEDKELMLVIKALPSFSVDFVSICAFVI